MIKFLLGISCLILFSNQYVLSQNTKSETVEYKYIQLPLNPLPSSIKNYQSSIFASYEADNQKKMAEYDAEMAVAEAEYQKELAAYPAKVKAADDKYAAEMAEWDKKSLGEKVIEKQILNENNKPVKQVPASPYKRYVDKPKLKTSYDYAALAATYLPLDGYTNAPENSVKIEVTMYGFEYTRPMQKSEVKSVVSSANGTSTTKNVTYYHLEFTYRHTMSVTVKNPDGTELFKLSPQELNNYKTYKSPESTTAASYSEEQLVKTYEEKILQENLTLIYNLVNDRIGFKRTPRKTDLHYVKSKDETYSDLQTAYNTATTGLKILLDDPEQGKVKLESASQLWQDALKESDPTNKKARIDKDVTIIICFNLLETSFATRNITLFEGTLEKLNTLSLSNTETKKKAEYEALLVDLKKRIEANNI